MYRYAERRVVWQTLESIFQSADPNRPSLANDRLGIGLIFPAYYELSNEQFDGLRNACLAADRRGCYLSLLVGETHPVSEERDFQFDWEETRERPSLPLPVENALMDMDGTWAILFSPDDHAAIAGDPTSVREIYRNWGTTPEEELARFLDYWNIRADEEDYYRAWGPALVEHVSAGST